ncbi:hypothetical protein [Streptomyces sp. MBT53]|uniref:hypothetical protein n=1 Tax=Streptomyces sp. MBT53 TaxID=1488384 RepID=UPI0019114022|nr:hypothetical protein [Streptomyces sp. MBT53]MBK6017718.1 hypothetical protein [Streptomyces sp. MBT53]
MANFQFGVNDYTISVRATQRVHLEQGWDGHRLTLTFEVSARDEYTVGAPFLVSGGLWTSDLPGSANWVGVLHLVAEPISLRPYATTITLGTTVTDRLLSGLEEARAGADLTLRAYLTLTALAETERWPSASDNEIIRIPDATWTEQLAQLGTLHP